MSNQIHVVMVSVPDVTVANQIASALLEQQLAACVQILPTVRSLYMWEGKLTEGNEQLLFIKAPQLHYSAIEALVLQLHPYQTPEVIALPVAQGHSAYLKWIEDVT
ncbi:divalent-cation tolerance protein CutA [Aliidiomarina celeris]|uniref:divalent-cation tolerance protein CutA n=1 Tax=Aliidiomarina celeris TaxID=2249428 RepID=UPI000DEACD7F|nr:divalent-cation tolerance protein CutA [Aliidiomarina celeris]